MSLIPTDLKYSKKHEWLRMNTTSAEVTIGLTDYAQNEMGDIVFVEAPEVDDSITMDQVCGVLESVKAAEDLYSPATGTVTEINSDLEDSPELVNSDPYGDGWIMKAEVSDLDALNELMDYKAYADYIGE